MTMDNVARNGLVLLGCGKMGSAMLAGWLKRGLPPESVWVIDPKPSDWLQSTGVTINGDLPEQPAIVLVAVKPQMMGDALPSLQALGNGTTLFVSVAAGIPIATFERLLGSETPVVRAMPNTPAAVGRGITAIIGNAHAGDLHLEQADLLLSAVGEVVRLEDEAQMDAVTGVSGSGPAYVFHMIECLAAAGEALLIKEEDPFECIRCGKPFGAKSSVEAMVKKLENHPMFQEKGGTERLKMCDDCRIFALAEEDEHPFAGSARPKPRTTDDYLREREELRQMAAKDMKEKGLAPPDDEGGSGEGDGG